MSVRHIASQKHLVFKLNVRYATDLADKDMSLLAYDVSDPYVIAYLRDASGKTIQRRKTRVIKDDLNPIWQEEMFDISMLVEDNMPDPCAYVYFEVWDKDVSFDDFLGQCVLPWSSIRAVNQREQVHTMTLSPRPNKKSEAVSGSLTVGTYYHNPREQSVHEKEKVWSESLGALLLKAVCEQHRERVLEILAKAQRSMTHDSRLCVVNAVDPESNTSALLHAVLAGASDIVRILLEAGCDTARKNIADLSALHVSVERGDCELAALLLAHGADPNLLANFDTPPLYSAVARGDTKMAELLREHGADVAFQDALHGSTLLDLAVEEDDMEAFKALLEMGAPSDRVQYKTACTLIMHVCNAGKHKFLRALFKARPPTPAELRKHDEKGKTALHFAAWSGSSKCARMLLEIGRASCRERV
eukprot:TRINITY_DN25819_c0_g1_i1.p1 TRINITY_DN25819_c0_g1~~TRINITY_DN25819_c0_g1_i1.p1  ORF type:complete len:417 (-),score=140.34 TRINITY_DN25819_c0_g1_i1:40-1290(-)